VRRNAPLLLFFIACAAVVALIAPPPAARAALNGYALLKQAVSADDHVSFYGTITSVVYARDTAAAAATVVRVEHRAPNEWRLWYVAPADAYGRLVLSNESVAYQYEPKTGKVYSNDWISLSPLVTSLDIDRIRHNYSVQSSDHASVSGRPARTLSLISTFSHTLVLRMWVDAATNLVLRRETYHADGTLATRTSFDNIRYVKDLPSDLFKMSVPAGMTLVPGAEYGKSTADFAALTSGITFKALQPKELPDGFGFQHGSTSMRGGVQSVQFVYSDGLRSISLFQNPSGHLPVFDGPPPKSLMVGKQNGEYTQISGESLLSWNSGGVNLTMVGDIAPKELARIGASLSP
jgi:outer membrane lipoprotein-sorting protein